MTIHLWNITAPPWYIIDQLPVRLIKSLGPDWTVKEVNVELLQFLDENKHKYKMTTSYQNIQFSGGSLFTLLRRAQAENVAFICLSVDVHVMDGPKT